MAKYVCTVCGYVYEGDAAPEICPVCKAPAEKFKLQEGEKVWAAEHVVGVAKGVSEDIVSDLRANFEGECSEVGMYQMCIRDRPRGIPWVSFVILLLLLSEENFSSLCIHSINDCQRLHANTFAAD